MKYLIILFFTIFLSIESEAQDLISNPKAIPAMPNPNALPVITPEKKPSIFDVKPKNDVPDLWSDKSKVEFKKEEFANPADRYTKKMNTRSSTEGDGDAKAFRRDQYFGDFRTKSETIKVMYRDPQAVDGDLLKVLLNDKVILDNIFLEGNFKFIEIKLVDGFNKIDFVALNEGQYFPNTGGFIIMDKGLQLYSSEWNMSTGFKASFIIVKE